MAPAHTPLERAFQLARSGAYRTVSQIKLQLKSEGLSDTQITGPTLTRQLAALCRAALADAPPEEVTAARPRPEPDF